MAKNFLQAYAAELAAIDMRTALATEPADGAAIKTAFDAVWDAQAFKAACAAQIMDLVTRGGLSTGTAIGGLEGAVTITSGGTGYAVGDKLPVTGSTGGEGGVIKVTSVAAGVIDGAEIWTVGHDYSGTITVVTTGIGDENCDLGITADYSPNVAVAEYMANVNNAGSASAVVVNAGGTGYAEDDQLTLASGIVITVGQTAGVVDTVKSIDTNVTTLTANITGDTATGGTGNDDATFDVTAYLV